MEYYYVADFETTVPKSQKDLSLNNDEYKNYIKNFETEVWLASFNEISNEDRSKYNVTFDIRSFMRNLLGEISLLDEQAEPHIFFHNLKFDGSFILNFLLSLDLPVETFISDMGQWYSITLKTDKHKIVFHDSLKVMNFKLSQIAEQVLSEISKGETPLLHEKPKKVKKEWIEYIKTDIEILSKAIYGFYIEQGYTRFTSASESLTEFKKMIGGNKKFREKFPVLSDDIDKILRMGYRGGFTYVKEDIQGKDIKHNIVVYDKNSMYPSTMLDYSLPVGKPKIFDGYIKKEYGSSKLHIYYGEFCFDLKENYVPCVQIRDNHALAILKKSKRDYLKSSEDLYIKMVVTEYDLQLMKNHYNLDFNIFQTFQFNSEKGIFDKYIHKYQGRKENAVTTFERLDAKIKLNSLYGKFGAKTKQQSKVPFLEDSILKFETTDVEIVKPVYLPVAMFITSISRWELINDIQNNYNEFLYCDTDSLHLLDNNQQIDLKIHPKKFGYWKKESECKRAKYLRPKLYIELEKNNHLIVTGAGMTEEVKKQVTFDNFEIGATFKGKRAQKQVKGGIAIYETEFTIRKNSLF